VTVRALLLVVGSAAGVLTGRALDGLGLLPGVHESEQVRRIALSPSWTAAGLAGCLLLGLAVARLLRRHAPAALVLLVLGQTAIVAAPEMAGRAGPSAGEAPLVVAVAVQVLLSLLTVSTALLVLQLVRPSLTVRPGPLRVAGSRGLPPYRVVLRVGRAGGVGGRAPPHGPCCPSHSHRKDDHAQHTMETGAGRGRSRPPAHRPHRVR
jgi:hypothetical protein